MKKLLLFAAIYMLVVSSQQTNDLDMLDRQILDWLVRLGIHSKDISDAAAGLRPNPAGFKISDAMIADAVIRGQHSASQVAKPLLLEKLKHLSTLV